MGRWCSNLFVVLAYEKAHSFSSQINPLSRINCPSKLISKLHFLFATLTGEEPKDLHFQGHTLAPHWVSAPCLFLIPKHLLLNGSSKLCFCLRKKYPSSFDFCHQHHCLLSDTVGRALTDGALTACSHHRLRAASLQ